MPLSRPFLHRLIPRGLGAWLALAFSLLTVILTLLLVEVVERAATAQVKSSIGNGLAEMAMQTADKLDRGMYERYREVQLMARRSDLVAPGASHAERRRILGAMQSTYGYYEWIGLASLDGTVLAEARGLLEGKNVARRPWFINALRGTHVGDVHEAMLLAKLLPVHEGEPRRFVDVAFPWLDANGKPAGVLGTHLSWEWARDVERSIIAPVQARNRVQALIVSAEGVVLLGPDDLLDKTVKPASLGQARQARTGYAVERWPDGRDYLVGYAATRAVADYPGLGWHVLVRQDIEDAYRPVRELRARAMWSGLALALLFSLAGVLVARRITRPLQALAVSAERLRRGDSGELVPAQRGFTEVRKLSGALGALVSDLVQRRAELQTLNDTLEQRVEQRTRELERALASVRASEQRIAAIVGAAYDAFIAVDQRGMILDWNPAAERMFGWSRHQAVGWPLAEMILPERHRASIAKALHAFRQSGDFTLGRRLERTVVNRQGIEFTVEVTLALAGEGEHAFFSMFLHDIAERKQRESDQAARSRSRQPLAALIRQVRDALDERAHQAGVSLRLDLPQGAEQMRAEIDHARMAQVVGRLVSNAIDATPRGREVTLGLAQRPGWARLSVTDEGAGIAPQQQDRVFERRVLPETTAIAPAGLDLDLGGAKAIVEEHGGTLGFETRAGMGTRFTVELPLA